MPQLVPMLVRAALTYGFLLIVLRLAGKRTVSRITPLELVVALLLSDLLDDVIWGEVPTARGLTALGSVMTLHLAVVWASYRWLAVDRLIGSRPSRIVADGRVVRGMLRREHVNEEDLASELRRRRIADIDEVQEAHVEPSGEVSVRRRPRARPIDGRDRARLRQLLRRP